jgi:hypothetical protein
MSWADLLRLALAPGFVAAITLIGRRAGPGVAGFLAGLPVVAAPILGLIVAEHGNHFGAIGALGSAIGTVPTMLFALAFARLAPRLTPLPCLGAAYGVYLVATGLALCVPVTWPFAIALPWLAWLALLRLFPHYDAPPSAAAALPWDLPLRVVAALALVLLVTAIARALGPEVAGIVTPFPIITATLALFSHRQGGPVTAAILLRALVRGLLSFVFFFWIVALLLPRTTAPLAFAGSTAACLAFHALLARSSIGAPARATRATDAPSVG